MYYYGSPESWILALHLTLTSCVPDPHSLPGKMWVSWRVSSVNGEQLPFEGDLLTKWSQHVRGSRRKTREEAFQEQNSSSLALLHLQLLFIYFSLFLKSLHYWVSLPFTTSRDKGSALLLLHVRVGWHPHTYRILSNVWDNGPYRWITLGRLASLKHRLLI